MGLKIIIINGPNLNLLGSREKKHYGGERLEEINNWLIKKTKNLAELHFFQSNIEGELIDTIQKASNDFTGIVLNAGAFTHYSIGIRDAIESVAVPVIEVHLSNISNREEFRQKSVIAPVCRGQISGMGKIGYHLAILGLIQIIENN